MMHANSGIINIHNGGNSDCLFVGCMTLGTSRPFPMQLTCSMLLGSVTVAVVVPVVAIRRRGSSCG